MPIATTHEAVNQALKSTKINWLQYIWKHKKIFLKHFPGIFQAFAKKINVYWVINLLPRLIMQYKKINDLGSYRTRLMPQTQNINIFLYCMNKQGIPKNVTHLLQILIHLFNLPSCVSSSLQFKIVGNELT